MVAAFSHRVTGIAFAAGIVALYILAPGAQKVLGAELTPQTLAAWETYVRLTEKRIAGELQDGEQFLALDFLGDAESQPVRPRLRNGQVYIRKLRTVDETRHEIPAKEGMIHHWMGAIFVPAVKLGPLLQWVQDYDNHHLYFDEVEASKLLSQEGETFHIFLRLRRKKIITVYYNTEHTAVYHYPDPRRVFSHSHTTKIAQLDNPGTSTEREKPVGNDSGFLWRLNSYWRFQEDDQGVFVECESLSLSRAIPFGLSWIIKGYVESIPRESLENTLTSIRGGVKKTIASGGVREAPKRSGSLRRRPMSHDALP